MARPTKFSLDVQERLCLAVRLGATHDLAARYAGISYETFRTWMRRGEAELSGEFSGFSVSIKRAEGEAAVRLMSRINLHAEKHWKAAAWILERRWPEYYGLRRRVEVQHSGSLGVSADPELLAALREAIRRAAPDDPDAVSRFDEALQAQQQLPTARQPDWTRHNH